MAAQYGVGSRGRHAGTRRSAARTNRPDRPISRMGGRSRRSVTRQHPELDTEPRCQVSEAQGAKLAGSGWWPPPASQLQPPATLRSGPRELVSQRGFGAVLTDAICSLPQVATDLAPMWQLR